MTHGGAGAEPEAWKYLSVAVPIVVIFGPIGAIWASHCHRQVHATTVYILDTVALVSLTFPPSLFRVILLFLCFLKPGRATNYCNVT